MIDMGDYGYITNMICSQLFFPGRPDFFRRLCVPILGFALLDRLALLGFGLLDRLASLAFIRRRCDEPGLERLPSFLLFGFDSRFTRWVYANPSTISGSNLRSMYFSILRRFKTSSC